MIFVLYVCVHVSSKEMISVHFTVYSTSVSLESLLSYKHRLAYVSFP